MFRSRLDFRVEFRIVVGGVSCSVVGDLLEVAVGCAHGYFGVAVRAGVQIAGQAVGEDMRPGRFWGLIPRGWG